MSLRRFLHESLDDILAEWEKEGGLPATGLTARRLHFGQVLRAVADEMNRMSASAATASAAAAATLAEDAPRRAGGGEPSHSHAGQLVDDYASLRASVLRQWRQKHPSPSAADLDELVHFNEAMDRSLAELSATFSPSQSQPNALFLGVLNHELRTLVASILMSGQVLTHRSAPGSPEGKAAQRILRSCEQLRQTLDALSDFTNVRLGTQIEIDRVEDDMGVLCRQALDEFARIDGERKVRLSSEGDLHGNWDAVRIREAIRGLIANAARFASRGSAVTIVVDGQTDDEVKVTVHGDGMPIDLDTLRTIFDPVARVESDNATYAGLGLGLFIVRKVVDAHGGQVSVDASEDHGTTFTVVLPRRA
jgi:signal transduction histidine kinase